MSKSKTIVSWVLRALVSLGFLFASLGKLTNNSLVIEMFENWGYPDGFYFLIGILEITFAVLLLIPKTLKIGIYGMVLIIIGAFITHLLHDPLLEFLRPLIFLLLLGGIYFLNYGKK